MPQKKSKKILIYFFLLILFGSINNVHIKETKLNHITNITVNGLNEKDNLIILNDIKKRNLGNIFFLNSNEIVNIINTNSLVENFKIFKKYPSSLSIKIDQTNFLAKINKNGKVFLVGSNGKLIKNNSKYNNLPFIFGNPEIKEFLKFKKIIDQSKINYGEIKYIYFFQSKRWDVEFKNNLTIKLPQDFTKKTLNNSLIFAESLDLKNNKRIDLRVKNQIITNE
tara:strand:+ start:1042 stop:1713 length:672 start_codon:yes stop_codon:yes gene_type:complete